MEGFYQSTVQGVEVPDAWLVAHAADPDAIFWLANPRNKPGAPNLNSHNFPNFRPRNITFDGDTGQTPAAATYADVRGIMWGEDIGRAKTRTMATHVQHSRAYIGIFAQGTTARGIEIGA
jgi:hypothetical protein